LTDHNGVWSKDAMFIIYIKCVHLFYIACDFLLVFYRS